MGASEGTMYLLTHQPYKEITCTFLISTWKTNNMYVIDVIFMGHVNPHMSVIWRQRDTYQEWKRT